MKVIRESIYYKIRTYTLDLNHADGGPKARWFSKALGFTLNNLEDLARQIDFDEKEAIPRRLNEKGQMYLQYATIVGANGRTIRAVRTYWIKETATGLIRFTNIFAIKTKGVVMIEELDVVKTKRNLTIEDLDGDEIFLAAGSRGTVMISQNGTAECIVEFGPIENASMIPIDKRYLQLIWSYSKECSKQNNQKGGNGKTKKEI